MEALKRPKFPLKEAIRLYEAGLTLRQVATSLGYTSVHYQLSRAGVLMMRQGMRSRVRRLQGETFSMILDVPAADGEVAHHHVDANLSYAPDGTLHEISFVGAGKAGHGISLLLSDLGIKLSRAIQGRSPETGE